MKVGRPAPEARCGFDAKGQEAPWGELPKKEPPESLCPQGKLANISWQGVLEYTKDGFDAIFALDNRALAEWSCWQWSGGEGKRVQDAT